MECAEARTLFLARRRGQLAKNVAAGLEAHLASCPECRRAEQADAELSAVLESRLSPLGAPPALRRDLAARWSGRRTPVRNATRAALALSALAAVAVVMTLLWTERAPPGPLVVEAVNDHLRVLYSDHPIEVASSDSHTVKPWFAGRIDFAPVVAFEGDADFPLQGGSIGYFIDRKAAIYHYRRRLHAITLLVFPGEGLPWPTAGLRPLGQVRATVQTARGFHTVLFRAGDLGYALVSDVDERELLALATRVAPTR